MPQPKTWIYRYTYHARWSPEDNQYVATVDEFPSLSALADLPHMAVSDLEVLVSGVIEDMISAGENLPIPSRNNSALPTDEVWKQAIDESWAWFEENLGTTPCALDVQYWIDGYVPRGV